MEKIFAAFLKGMEEGRHKVRKTTNNSHFKLVESSTTGRIVELEVTEQNETVAKMYLSQLETYLQGLRNLGVQWNIKGRRIQISFPNVDMAEYLKEAIKK